MQSQKSIARALAATFVDGRLDVDELVDRGSQLLGRRWRWLRPLAKRIVQSQSHLAPLRKTRVEKLILADNGFYTACQKHRIQLAVSDISTAVMCPEEYARQWNVSSIATTTDLASFFGLTIKKLEWYSDRRRLESKQSNPKLRHYRYRKLNKRPGSFRLIEAPKPKLKSIQRQILADILNHVPPHCSAHGFRAGHSIMTFATPHVGKAVVLKLDLQDFFPSIGAARIEAIFRSIGYPEPVADLLAGLCTNSTPTDVWQACSTDSNHKELRQKTRVYESPHLPQGAPTSPSLANLCAFRMDSRLSGLAKHVGATYTRYADDLAFSGDRDFKPNVKRFMKHVCKIIVEEGFFVHRSKTNIMSQGCQQRIAGIVVNRHLNIQRHEFDRLKAILTNCIRKGWQSQNVNGHADFRSHLQGRISFVEMINPSRGEKLRRLFEQVNWSQNQSHVS